VESARQAGELEDPRLRDEIFRLGEMNKDLNGNLAVRQSMLKAQSVAIKGLYDELLTAKQITSDLRADNQYYAAINTQLNNEWHRMTEETSRVIWHHRESIQHLEHENHRLSLQLSDLQQAGSVRSAKHRPPFRQESQIGDRKTTRSRIIAKVRIFYEDILFWLAIHGVHWALELLPIGKNTIAAIKRVHTSAAPVRSH
jgi:hypothetical protein